MRLLTSAGENQDLTVSAGPTPRLVFLNIKASASSKVERATGLGVALESSLGTHGPWGALQSSLDQETDARAHATSNSSGTLSSGEK